jgi:hypothetical protein
MKSIETGEPVRVIRKDECEWIGRPKKGFRYDGLYKVTTWREREKRKGEGKFAVFRLVRCEGQGEIQRRLPTLEQARLFERLGDDF